MRLPACSLHLLYGKNLGKALEVVDGGGIVCYEGARTRRRVFRVGRAMCIVTLDFAASREGCSMHAGSSAASWDNGLCQGTPWFVPLLQCIVADRLLSPRPAMHGRQKAWPSCCHSYVSYCI